MEGLVFLAPFIPFLTMLPPCIAAVWIAHRWFKTRGASAEVRAELAALREEVATLRHAQAETQERLDFAERVLSQLREAPRELPRGSP